MSQIHLGLSDEFLAEIGRIAILQSHVEALLGELISNLADIDGATGDAITTPLSFRQLIQVGESLIALNAPRLGQYAPATADLLIKAKKSEDRRNQIVHSMWSFGPDFDPAVAARLKRSGKPPEMKAHEVPLTELQELSEELWTVTSGLTFIHPFLKKQKE